MTQPGRGQAVVGLTGYGTESGGTTVYGEQFVKFALPETVTAEHIEQMRIDFETLAELARQHPDDIAEIQNAVASNDFGRAGRVASRIGLNEERLAAAGGASVAVAIGIVVILLVGAAILGHVTHAPDHVIVGPEGGVPPTNPHDGGADAGGG